MFIMIIYNDNCIITCTSLSFLNYIQFFYSFISFSNDSRSSIVVSAKKDKNFF